MACTAGLRGTFAALLAISTATALAVLWWLPEPTPAAGQVAAAFAFSEGSGTVAADASGHGHTGTLTGPSWIESGRYGGALLFDGSDDLVVVPDGSALDLTASFTLGAWVHPTADVPSGTVLRKAGASGDAYALGLLPGGLPYVTVTTAAGTAAFAGDEPVFPDRWTHLAAAYNGSSIRLFVNGIKEWAWPLSGAVTATGEALTIGGAPESFFEGRIDEVRIDAFALDVEAVRDDMNTPVDLATPLTVGTHTPASGARGVLVTPIAARFTRAIEQASLTADTVVLRQGGTDVPSARSYDAATRTVTLTLASALAPLTDYSVTVLGGPAGVMDAAGGELASTVVWSFRTGSDANTVRLAYGFGVGVGANADDASGNGNDGTLLNGPTWTDEGRYGHALLFDGADDTIRVPDADTQDATTGLTLEAWVYPTAAASIVKVIQKQHYGPDHSYWLGLAGGAPYARVRTAGGAVSVVGPAALPLNEWAHTAATYDGSALRVFVNGLEIASQPATGELLVSHKPLWVGSGFNGEWFHGRIDDVRLYARALSAAEIVADMNTSVEDVAGPGVTETTPTPDAVDVRVGSNVTATFSEPLAPASVSSSTFGLRDALGVLVSSTVSYDAATRTATLDPADDLVPGAVYAATLEGGAAAPRITDLAGNPMATGYSWSFTTAASSGPPTVVSVSVFPRSMSLSVGGSHQFSATATWSDATTTDVSTVATWSSSATGVLTVNASGRATGDGPGASVLTATYQGHAEEAPVTVYEGEAIPPDPRDVAPALNRTSTTPLFRSAAFLFTGENPIQRGVAAGAIENRRISVIRGRVVDPSGAPVTGVRVAIAGHEELGHTLTRLDGAYDLAVNGGGRVTLEYTRAGLLTTRRQTHTDWQDYSHVPDVALVPLDPQVTAIDLASSTTTQVAQGSVVTDADGSRQATLLFRPGTAATLVLPDGTDQPLTSLAVRATEYSVGPAGERAMPAPLPATSGYTYAVEYSVDQAIAAGAREVRFSQPVITYTTNFLGFPAGEVVPVGYFDRAANAWVARDNGRVIAVVGETAGRADLDVDGSGGASPQSALDELGIGDAERESLAALYDPGASVWRVPIAHFSTYDYNWPIFPDADARPPKLHGGGNRDDDTPDCQGGSIIECQNQTLGEAIPIAGAPFSLHYRSSRAPGRKSAFTIEGPLTTGDIPASLKRVDLEIHVAGHQVRQTFPAQANLRYSYTWDGTDAFGRIVQGSVRATVIVFYAYDAFYGRPRSERRSFALTGTQGIQADLARGEVIMSQTLVSFLGLWDMAAGPAGGWSLGVHHFYDLWERVAYLGDGRMRSIDGEIWSHNLTTAAGSTTLDPGAPTENVPATSVVINPADDVTAAPDGSVYFSELGTSDIRRLRPDGVLETVAGVPGVVGAIAPEGSLYLYDEAAHVIRRRAPDGTVSVVAGMPNQAGYTGDGGPATEARLNGPCALAAAPDGALYIGEFRNDVIRRVDAGGTISTFAGSGTAGDGGDGGPATSAQFSLPCGLAVGPDGSIYVADLDNSRVRRITPDGIIRAFAGNGNFGTTGDGGIATAAAVDAPWKVSASPAGVAYITEFSGRIRRVDADGIISTFAGAAGPRVAGDTGPAAATPIGARGVTASPDGSIYATTSALRDGVVYGEVRRIGPSLPGISAAPVAFASEDGAELYVFEETGRHLRTLDALTGAVRFTFEYDAAGRLAAIRDGDGNVTTIERASGAVRRIVAPGAVATAIDTGASGLVTRVTDPAGSTWALTYADDGLLLTFTDPNGGTAMLTYDDDGRLASDRNAAGGTTTLAVESPAGDTTVTTLTSALGRTDRYALTRSPLEQVRVHTDPAGLVTRTVRGADAADTTTMPDGTLVRVERDADPRFQMDAPLPTRVALTTPGGLVSTTEARREVELSNPADPLSLVFQLDELTVNGRTFVREYDRATNTLLTITPEGRRTTTRLDAQGRIVEWAAAGLTPVGFTYDASGLLTTVTQGPRQSTLAYDAQRRPATLTDALGRPVSFTYDAAGRVATQTRPDGGVIAVEYDFTGNVLRLTPPGRPAHRFGYTPVDLTARYTPPAVAGAGGTAYEYNLDTQLTAIHRPGGQTIAFTYNDGAHVTGVTFSRGTLGYTHDAAGRLATLTDPGGVGLTFTYDGPLPLGEAWSGPVRGTVTRTFTPDVQVATEQVGTSAAVAFAYDDDGLLTAAGALSVARHDDTGLVTGTFLEQTTETFEPSAFGELSRQTAAVSGTPVFDVQYVRDALGRIAQRTETVDGVTRVFEDVYDLAGRLQLVRRNGAAIAVYTYDSNGNRIQEDGETGLATATYDDQDRLLTYGGVTFTYAPNGELATKTEGGLTTTYAYDTLGNLRRVDLPDGRVVAYEVDGRGRRVAKLVDGVVVRRWLYGDQLRPVAEVDAAGEVIARFVYGVRPNVPAYIARDGATYRVFADHLGSPRVIVHASTGEVVQRLDFDAFGRVTQDSNPGWQPFGFAGGLYDPDTGLVRFGARDYQAETGRWTAKDPIGFAARSTNLYQYALRDPVNRRDFDGLRDWFIGAELDLVGGTGVELGIGIVFDSDNWWDSGIYATMGVAAGANVGIGIGGGFACREIEGAAVNIDANLSKGSGVVSFDDRGFNGISGSVGPGIGGSTSLTETATLSIGSVIRAVQSWLR